MVGRRNLLKAMLISPILGVDFSSYFSEEKKERTLPKREDVGWYTDDYSASFPDSYFELKHKKPYYRFLTSI